MGKKKSSGTTTATYQYQAPPSTPDIDAARNVVQQGADFTTPIVHSYARAADDVNNQYFETDLPDAARERAIQGQMFRLNQERGAALADAKSAEQQAKQGGYLSMAGLTSPQLVQTGGASTGTQSGFFGPAFATALGGSLGSA